MKCLTTKTIDMTEFETFLKDYTSEKEEYSLFELDSFQELINSFKEEEE